MICSKCRRRPKAEQQRILATDEVYGFLSQSNISKKNIKRLEQLASIEDAKFQDLRKFVMAIAAVLPRKRKRWKLLRQQHPHLLRSTARSSHVDDLLEEAQEWPEFDDKYEFNLDDVNSLLLECALDDQEP